MLVIVVDVNPIWWGQQAQRETDVSEPPEYQSSLLEAFEMCAGAKRPSTPQLSLSKCLDAVMVLGNSYMAMARTSRLAVIASHCEDR